MFRVEFASLETMERAGKDTMDGLDMEDPCFNGIQS